jgi:hypothetical protein
MSSHAAPETLARIAGLSTSRAALDALAALSDRFSVVIQDTAVLEERARHAAKVE